MRCFGEGSEGCARSFDERFFAYIEDVNLDWRMRRLGWKVLYELAVARHYRSATGPGGPAIILRHIGVIPLWWTGYRSDIVALRLARV